MWGKKGLKVQELKLAKHYGRLYMELLPDSFHIQQKVRLFLKGNLFNYIFKNDLTFEYFWHNFYSLQFIEVDATLNFNFLSSSNAFVIRKFILFNVALD